MKRTAIAVAAAAALTLLAGCAGTPQDAAPATGAASAPVATSTPPEDAPPLAAATPDSGAQTGEAAYLDEVRSKLRPNNVIPDATDDQLVSAGSDACEQLKTAETSSDISVIENEPTNGAGRYSDSAVIVSAAQAFLCP